jgi:hypothetical protein
LWEPPTPDDRFWAKVDKNGPVPSAKPELGLCWLWTASKSSEGYGKGKRLGVDFWAHRLACELTVGPISEGMTLDHLCRNPACVNAAHLEPVPSLVNVMRGFGVGVVNAAKVRCDRNHEFTPENTIYAPDGHRTCRICKRDKQRERRAKQRRAVA